MMQIVQEGNSEFEGESRALVSWGLATAKSPVEELFPDIAVERSREGIEKGKGKAKSLFASGSIEGSVRWYSKCIFLLDAGKATEAPSSLQSVLHSNRAIAYIKLKMWAEAEEDATKPLIANPQNKKAMYWRGVARLELGYPEAADGPAEPPLHAFVWCHEEVSTCSWTR